MYECEFVIMSTGLGLFLFIYRATFVGFCVVFVF